MNTCPKCGHENREGASFCAWCGIHLEQGITCPNCGTVNPSSNSFCTECGTSFAALKSRQHYMENDPQIAAQLALYAKRKKTKRIWGWITVVLLVFIFGWLEFDWPEFFADVGLLGFVPALIVFIVAAIRCAALKKKIGNALDEHTYQSK